MTAKKKKKPDTGERMRSILVVDDYEDAREMCCEILRYAGYEAFAARDGHEALDLARSRHPDLILMDLSIPGIDGWEATRRLKSDEATADIIVVALTGHALGGHEEGAKSAGCDAFLTKPCLPDDLLAAVKELLERGAGASTRAKREKSTAKKLGKSERRLD